MLYRRSFHQTDGTWIVIGRESRKAEASRVEPEIRAYNLHPRMRVDVHNGVPDERSG